MPDTQLYHVGCGKPLFTVEAITRGTMAVACHCGAQSPICVQDINDDAVLGRQSILLPATLAFALQAGKFGGESPPHVEYYLGFSDFQCPAKAAWDRELRERFGMISMSECDDPACVNGIKRRHERAARLAEVRLA